jgi:hypothetical protein
MREGAGGGRPAVGRRRVVPLPPPRRLVAATVALGLAVAALDLLGPLAGGVVRYRLAPPLRDQLIGSDLVVVTVAVPLLLVAALLVRRSSPVGPLLALGPALACWYLLAQVVVGQDRTGRYPGNDEIFLPLFIGVLLLASGVAVGAWRALPRERVVFDSPTRTLVGWLLLAVAVLDVFGRYLPAWLAVVDGGARPDYSAGPGIWWALAVGDLTLLLPTAAVTGFGLLRRAGWAPPAAFAASGALAIVTFAAAGRAWAATVQGHEGATVGSALLMSAVALASAAPAGVCWLAVLRTGARAWRELPQPAPFIPVPRAPADHGALLHPDTGGRSGRSYPGVG